MKKHKVKKIRAFWKARKEAKERSNQYKNIPLEETHQDER
jgi:hypothetical protein